MGKVIDYKLENFNDFVKDNIRDIENTLTLYKENVTKLLLLNKEVKTSLPRFYKGDAAFNINHKISEVDFDLLRVKKMFEEELTSSVTKVNKLVEKVEILKNLEKEINELERDLLYATDEKRGLWNKKCIAFDDIQEEAMKIYNDLYKTYPLPDGKGLTSSKKLLNLTFEELPSGWKFCFSSYTASSSRGISFILYLPPSFQNDIKNTLVTSIPEPIIETSYEGVIKTGLAKLIHEGSKNYNANTVVLCPVLGNNNLATSTFIREDLKDLTDAIINNFNIDPNKNIITGINEGGTGSIYMASNYNNYYKGVVCYNAKYIDDTATGIFSYDELKEKLDNLKIISYYDNYDCKKVPSSMTYIKTWNDMTSGDHLEFNNVIKSLIS